MMTSEQLETTIAALFDEGDDIPYLTTDQMIGIIMAENNLAWRRSCEGTEAAGSVSFCQNSSMCPLTVLSGFILSDLLPGV